jgi:hypothetical protein
MVTVTRLKMCRRVSLGIVVLAFALVPAATGPTSAAGQRFYDDDPIAVEPDPHDASGVQEWEIPLLWDLAYNSFGRPGDPQLNVRAGSINTIDEVPDSSWFTNRMLARPLALEDAVRGPLTSDGPADGTWTVVASKSVGMAPGFTVRDSRGTVWFLSFDAAGHPEAATGAILVANKLFWALGYWQVENHLTTLRRETLEIADTALIEVRPGHKRQVRMSDIDDVLDRAHRSADGTYRARGGRCPARRSADSGITARGRTTRTTSSRTSTGASCARSGCSARG